MNFEIFLRVLEYFNYFLKLMTSSNILNAFVPQIIAI